MSSARIRPFAFFLLLTALPALAATTPTRVLTVSGLGLQRDCEIKIDGWNVDARSFRVAAGAAGAER